jgi:nitroreductase
MREFIPYSPPRFTVDEQRTRVQHFYEYSNLRRSVRTFSGEPIPRDILETIILTAGTAPSGANKQPWRFVVVTDPMTKKEIRTAAEKEEQENYEHRMSDEWLRDLEPFGTDWHKDFLETAPALIVVFSVSYDKTEEQIRKNYYVKESVGIACGFLLAAIHHAGLVALTHTPSPMDFLSKILRRPENEKPFLLIPVGYPAKETMVPDISRKPLNDICVWR